MKNLDRELSDAQKIIKIRSETKKLQPFKVGEFFEIFGIWRIFVLEILDFHPKTVSNLKKLSIFFSLSFDRITMKIGVRYLHQKCNIEKKNVLKILSFSRFSDHIFVKNHQYLLKSLKKYKNDQKNKKKSKF